MFKRFAIKLARQIQFLGINFKILTKFIYFPFFVKDFISWKRSGGQITSIFMVLSDYSDDAGTAKGHYFHQDLLVAGFIHKDNPDRHIDIGSRVDGFVAHVATFREIEVVDIRNLNSSVHKNIKFKRADFMSNNNLGKTDSLSCLHALEHFGLGRYSDPIDIKGHEKGLSNLVNLLKNDGKLYLSFPIGDSDEVHFNAHRVFHPKSVLEFDSIKKQTNLIRFDFVDDFGELHLKKSPDDAIGKVKYGCGIYTFKKLILS